MNQLAVPTGRVKLDGNHAVGEAWRVYKRLFKRSTALGAIVFGVTKVVTLLAVAVLGIDTRAGIVTILFSVGLTLGGLLILEGALIELVRPLHDDGDAEPTLAEVWQRANGRFGSLLGSSLLTTVVVSGVALISFGTAVLALKAVGAIGGVLFIPAFFATMTAAMRMSLVVPVVMLEDASATDAVRRSNELVRGNAWQVFLVFFGVGLITFVIQLPLALVARSGSFLVAFVAGVLGSALAKPLVAHSLSVMYYRLAEPRREVLMPPGQKNWESVWAQQRAADQAAAPAQDRVAATWAEYEKKFG